MGTRDVHTGFWWGNIREDNLEAQSLDGRIILKWIFKKLDGRAWAGLIWLSSGEAWESNKVIPFAPPPKLKCLLLVPSLYLFFYSSTVCYVSVSVCGTSKYIRDEVGIFFAGVGSV